MGGSSESRVRGSEDSEGGKAEEAGASGTKVRGELRNDWEPRLRDGRKARRTGTGARPTRTGLRGLVIPPPWAQAALSLPLPLAHSLARPAAQHSHATQPRNTATQHSHATPADTNTPRRGCALTLSGLPGTRRRGSPRFRGGDADASGGEERSVGHDGDYDVTRAPLAPLGGRRRARPRAWLPLWWCGGRGE
jgi:hypothetical protein